MNCTGSGILTFSANLLELVEYFTIHLKPDMQSTFILEEIPVVEFISQNNQD